MLTALMQQHCRFLKKRVVNGFLLNLISGIQGNIRNKYKREMSDVCQLQLCPATCQSCIPYLYLLKRLDVDPRDFHCFMYIKFPENQVMNDIIQML